MYIRHAVDNVLKKLIAHIVPQNLRHLIRSPVSSQQFSPRIPLHARGQALRAPMALPEPASCRFLRRRHRRFRPCGYDPYAERAQVPARSG